MTASHAYPLKGGYGSAVICAFSREAINKYSSSSLGQDAVVASARLSILTAFHGQGDFGH